MEAREITELFARFLHLELTKRRYLKLVEHLAEWEPERLLDLQETLLEHLASGLWVATRANVVATTAGRPGVPIGILPKVIEFQRAQGEMFGGDYGESLVAWAAALEKWQPVPYDIHPVPDDAIGIPFSIEMLIEGPAVRLTGDAIRAERTRLEQELAEHARFGIDRFEQLPAILRAAPWAYHRATGDRMPGYPPHVWEEKHTPGAKRARYRAAIRLRRDDDRVEVVLSTRSWSEDLAEYELREQVAIIARTLGASIDRRHGVPTGRTGTALAADAVTLLTTGRPAPPPMPEHEFWALVDVLDGDDSARARSRLRSTLSKRPIDDIRAFDHALEHRVDALDGALPDDSVGDNGFRDLRVAVVFGGRGAYERVLADRRIVVAQWSERGEELGGIAEEAFERALHSSLPGRDETLTVLENGVRFVSLTDVAKDHSAG
jgi:hypothetical protein